MVVDAFAVAAAVVVVVEIGDVLVAAVCILAYHQWMPCFLCAFRGTYLAHKLRPNPLRSYLF